MECRLLGRLTRVRRTSECCWQQQGRPAGAPGARYARRLARARGSVYRRQRGTPCPPLLPPRRPLAKREQRRELSFTWLSALARWKNRAFLFFSFLSFSISFCARDFAKDRYRRSLRGRHTSWNSCNVAGKSFVKRSRRSQRVVVGTSEEGGQRSPQSSTFS